MHGDMSLSVPDICKTLRISRPTPYRYLAMKLWAFTNAQHRQNVQPALMMKAPLCLGLRMALLALGLAMGCETSPHRAESAGGAGGNPVSNEAHPQLTRFQIVQGSWVRIEGSTSMHDWQARSLDVNGFIEVVPGFPNDYAASGPATGERVEVSVPVHSLKSIDLDGKPFSTAFDDMLHEALQANAHPEAVYRLTKLVRAPSTGAGPPCAFDSTGELCIAGVTNRVPIDDHPMPTCGSRVTDTDHDGAAIIDRITQAPEGKFVPGAHLDPAGTQTAADTSGAGSEVGVRIDGVIDYPE